MNLTRNLQRSCWWPGFLSSCGRSHGLSHPPKICLLPVDKHISSVVWHSKIYTMLISNVKFTNNVVALQYLIFNERQQQRLDMRIKQIVRQSLYLLDTEAWLTILSAMILTSLEDFLRGCISISECRIFFTAFYSAFEHLVVCHCLQNEMKMQIIYFGHVKWHLNKSIIGGIEWVHQSKGGLMCIKLGTINFLADCGTEARGQEQGYAIMVKVSCWQKIIRQHWECLKFNNMEDTVEMKWVADLVMYFSVIMGGGKLLKHCIKTIFVMFIKHHDTKKKKMSWYFVFLNDCILSNENDSLLVKIIRILECYVRQY